MGHAASNGPHADSASISSASCPIDILSDDILYELFRMMIADANADLEDQISYINSLHTTPMQVTLAGVCRRWRETVTTMPSLWTRITVDCSRFRTNGALPHERLELYLASSGRLPLSLYLTSTDRGNLSLSPALERLYGDLLDSFRPHYRRWKDVTFLLDHRLARKLLSITPTYADTIESISIDFRTQFWFDDDPHEIPTALLSLLIRFPKLTRLDWRSCSPWSYIPSPTEIRYWKRLLDVTINVSYGLPHLVALTILQHLTSAESVNLNAYVLRPRADGFTREVLSATHALRCALPDIINLPALRNLKLVVDHEVEIVHDRVLGMIAAPGLETLVLSLDSTTMEDGALLLREVRRLVAGAPNLRKFYLRLWRSRCFQAEDVAHLIMMCYGREEFTKFDLVADTFDLLPVIKWWIEGHEGKERLKKLVELYPLRGMSKFDAYPHIVGY